MTDEKGQVGESGGLVVKPQRMTVGSRLGVGREEASRMKPRTLSGSLPCGDTPAKDQTAVWDMVSIRGLRLRAGWGGGFLRPQDPQVWGPGRSRS